jgi:formylglycine-generating enzyme required for sulfatase activity
MVPRLKLAAKAGLFAASLVSASLVADAAQAPTADADSDAPETVAVAAAAFGYRLAGDFQEEGRTVDAPKETRSVARFRIMKYQLRRVPKTSASTFLAFTALFVGGEPINPIR